MAGQKRWKSRKVGFNLNSDMLKALSDSQGFACREITSDFVGFERVGKTNRNRGLFFTAPVKEEK